MCYEKRYFEQKDAAASQSKKLDTKREDLVHSVQRSAEKAEHKVKEDARPVKQPVPAD